MRVAVAIYFFGLDRRQSIYGPGIYKYCLVFMVEYLKIVPAAKPDCLHNIVLCE